MSIKATPKCSFIPTNFSRKENRFIALSRALLAESFILFGHLNKTVIFA